MRKVLGILALGSAVLLSACGGESDSSGSASDYLESYPACQMSGSTIIVEETRVGCRVKKPDLNNGKTFVLSCRTYPSNIMPPEFSITTTSDGNIKSIENDISTFSKYAYSCVRSTSFSY